MKKAIIILLTALVALSMFVSCNQDSILDEEFSKEVTVVFDSNNGSGATATQTIVKKTATALDANKFKYKEHIFVSWNTKADGDGTTYSDTQVVTLRESVTLYAQWSEVSYFTEETTTLVPGKAYSTAGEETIISERIMISAAESTGIRGIVSRDVILKEERKPVVIFLEEGTTLIVEKGIEVAEGQELNIQGFGTLIANAGVGSAGIGGGPNMNAGTIVISGGTVITTGGTFAAGIGGGNGGNGGVVTIIGGNVTATGGLSGGAGIGGGRSGNGAEVSLQGGTVRTFGGEPSVSIPMGLGIGAGYGGKSAGTLQIGESQGLYGGKDEETAEFLSNPTDSYAGTRFEFMETKATKYATITFVANGGEGEMEAQVVPYNIPRNLNANEFTHETLFFDGWALSEEGEVKYKNQAQIELDGDITLYAHWIDVIMIDDTYGGTDGKKLEGGKRYSIEKNLTIGKRLYIDGTDEVTLTLPQGNTLTLSSGLNVASGQSLIIEGEGSLVATAVSSGDAGIGGSKGASAGTITIKGGTVTATGGSGGGIGIGAGYGSTEHGVLKINKGLGLFGGADKDNVAFLSAPVDSYAGDRTVYMESKATSYVTVTFKPNGGEQTKDKTQTIPKGFGVPLAENTFTHKTLTFAGWITDTAKEEADYSDKQVVTLENNLTLYALWIDVIVLDASYGGTEGKKLEGGKSYTIESDLIIKDRLLIVGKDPVTIVLPKDMTLTLSSGLEVSKGHSVIIEGDGSLVATAVSNGYAGIGGNSSENAGNITINGGTVTATGGTLAAGIGGGFEGDGGTVTINDGTVTVKGGNQGAGIGGGDSGVGGTVIINGGTVTAVGGDNYGAGIGGGLNSNGGTVTINGGTVTATGGSGATGIGKGFDGDYNGTLTIGKDMGLFGGADQASAAFLSAPVVSYDGTRTAYMEAKETEYVTVTFKPNGGKETEDKTQSVPKGFKVPLAENTFTNAPLTFNGWNTQADGKGTSYSNKQKVTLESDLTLYAQWVDIVYLTTESTTLEGGRRYSISDNLTISDNRLVVTGDQAATLDLPAGKTLTLEKGINVSGSNSLIIEGEGTLNTTGETTYDIWGQWEGSAGIGGDRNNPCGTVTIKGGEIYATGSNGAAGIGGGGWQYGPGQGGGTVTILGGKVTATGGQSGAGIGGGYGRGNFTITIEDGTVSAAGGSGGAGIGGGGGDTGHGGKITISGGKVTATGGSSGSGIGGGSYANGGAVTITGGDVTATGGNDAAGIGGGYAGGKGATVEISGNNTVVTAIGGSGAAGIGGGAGSQSSSKAGGDGGAVTISGGTVTATGGNHGAGIGGGSGNAGYPAGNGGTVTISGGTVTATGGANAAGIGGGGSYNDTNGGASGTITIEGGNVTAIGKDKAAGIGGGGSGKYLGGGVGETIIITGGTVQATGGNSEGVGIGGGRGETTRANDGSLKIGSTTLGLYGGANQGSSQFRSFPTDSYTGTRYAYMESKPTEYVTITFNGNGGTESMDSQQMVKDLASIDLSANAFKTPDESKIFIGWATSATGDVVYSDEGTIAFSKSETLYARWGTDVVITESLKKLVAGHNHVLTGDVTNKNRLYIADGDSATITLAAGKTLTLTSGINVPAGKTLTIEGTGTLNATGSGYQAGIGGNDKQMAGSVIINGGTITARGSNNAAGIGAGGHSGSNGGGQVAGGYVEINGGTVEAYGSGMGSGIGGGGGGSLNYPGTGGTVVTGKPSR